MTETRRARRHRATREEILAVARGLMLEEGFQGLSIREIARRTGLGPASLYTYFAGKDEIAAALTEGSFRELDECLARVPEDLAPDARLMLLATAYLEFAGENPADLACIVMTGLSGALPAGVDPAVTEAALAYFTVAVRRGVDDGRFAAGDEAAIAERAYGLWALVHGLAVLSQAATGQAAARSSADPQSVVRAAVAALRAAGERPADGRYTRQARS
jgi:AcrR family transcriptional regulator